MVNTKVRTFPISPGLLGHKGRMGIAIYEFMWLLDQCTSDEPLGDGKFLGIVKFGQPITAEIIATDLNESVDTAKINLRKLASEGYVVRKRVFGAGFSYSITNSKKWLWRRENRTAPHRVESPSIGNLLAEGNKPADDRAEKPSINKEGKTLERQNIKTLPNPPCQGGNRITKRDLRKLQNQILLARKLTPDGGKCRFHPNSGRTESGGCWGCYSNPPSEAPFFPVKPQEVMDACRILLLPYRGAISALDAIEGTEQATG